MSSMNLNSDISYYYVYILQSEKDTNRFYTGFTENFKNRLKEHNTGKNKHTAKY
ncbi:GIY-YIG nuclease family protein, partial [Thermodesulfobacteriota bacterium]